MYLYEPVVTSLWSINHEDFEYVFGIGNKGIQSDVIGVLSTWFFYYALIHVLYYVLGGLMKWYVAFIWPEAGTNKVPSELSWEHIKRSEIAFPLYVLVPVIGDSLKKKGLSSTCDSIEECGGVIQSFVCFAIFVLLLEFIVFFDHYYVLHIWKWGKKNLKHDDHHKYEANDEMTTWTGYAFDPWDGFSQGIGIALCQVIVPVPAYFIWVLSLLIGTWTMYIHQGVPTLPLPLMGADYHFVHHKYNWYNFGFFTIFWDWVFGTLKHPTKEDTWKHSKYLK
eukprot:277226_1